MKSYPSISTAVDFSLSYCVFDKLDGSNIRAEWSAKKGFYKFGTRTQLLTCQSALWPAQERIASCEDRLGPVLASLKTQRAVCFFEWVGPSSFAGSHHDQPDDMSLVLLDVDVFAQGRLAPHALLDVAIRADVPTPSLLHEGKVDHDFLLQVHQGVLPHMSLEGVVGKSIRPSRPHGGPVMFKHKTQQWLDQLKTLCGSDQHKFDQLK